MQEQDPGKLIDHSQNGHEKIRITFLLSLVVLLVCLSVFPVLSVRASSVPPSPPSSGGLISRYTDRTGLIQHSERLSGYVVDADGRPIERVRVLIEYPGYHRVGSTNSHGYYSISTPHLTDDAKSVEFSREGFHCHRVDVIIEEDTRLNVTLNRIDTDPTVYGGDEIPVTILLMGLITLLGFYLLSGDRKYVLAGHIGIPLYSKLDRSGVLGQRTRKELYDFLLTHPGVNYTTMLRELNFGTSTIVHHLTILEREGFVRSRKELGRRLFYPKGMSLPRYSGTSSLPPSPIQRAILEYLRDHGPSATNRLEQELHIKRSTLVYSLSRLKERGLVHARLHGRSAVYHAAEGSIANDLV